MWVSGGWQCSNYFSLCLLPPGCTGAGSRTWKPTQNSNPRCWNSGSGIISSIITNCAIMSDRFFFSLSLKTLQLGKLKSPNPHKLLVILNLNFKCRFPLKWWCPLLEIHFSFLEVFNLNFMFAFEFAHESVHLYTLGKAFSCWVLCGICDL